MKSAILFLTISLYSAFAFAQDCASITATGVSGQININGVSGAPIATVQVFNSSWTSIFNQTYNNHNGSTIVVAPLTPGQYFVNVRLYNSNWTSICEKGMNATVPNAPPPPGDTCTGTFQKAFGTAAGSEESFHMTKASDGSYITVGQTSASGTGNNDGLVMKFDNKGTQLWSKTLGGAQQDYFSHVVPTSDAGCLAVGSANSTGINTFSGDIWLVRLDGSGNVLWQKRYFVNGSAGNTTQVIQTSDGGFALTGTFPYTPGSADWMTLKLDANGNIQWQRKLGSGNSDSGNGIAEDNTGGAGVVVCGILYSTSGYDAVISKLDLATGNLMWTKAYDFDSRANWIGPIIKTSNGFLFNLRNATGFGVDASKPGIFKTDFNGNVQWVKEYNLPINAEGKITLMPDGSIMMEQGEVIHDPAIESDIYMMRIDPSGNLLWAKRYTRPGAQFFWSLATDGNFAVGAGYATAGSYKDLLLAKIDMNGKMGTCSSQNVSPTVRNCVVNNLNFSWPVNTPLNLSVEATTFTPGTTSFTESVVCSDGCPTVTVGSANVNENAGTATIQVCLSQPAANTLVYYYTTADGTATSGSDYTGGSGTVTIAPGQNCGTFTIPILNDANIESTETFTVSIGSASGTVTINDDDQPQGNCNGVTITPGSNQITITGVTAALATVQVFNSSWATVFNQTYNNAPGTVNVPIAPGTYLVKVTFYTANWGYICDKSENVTVINQCPAGMICISNICPETTVDLYDAYSIPNLPAGTTVTWHTGSPATDGNKLTEEQARNVSASGTYYAAVYISGSGCYSSTIAVSVTINPCAGGEVSPGTTLTEKANMVQLKSTDQPSVRNITVFPNPFARTLRVVIDSEKSEKATIALMDVRGKELKQISVKLSPGSNAVLLEGLDRYPSGNYFLKINSASGTKTMKVMRGQ